MAIPPKARGRKRRLVRAGETPHDLLLVVRATPADRSGAVNEIAEDAELSARQYVVEDASGITNMLFGVSVFAHRTGVAIVDVLARFVGAASYFEVTVGALRAGGFEVLPTGANVDHFDIQLLIGIEENTVSSSADLRGSAERLLAIVGPLKPNPAYAGSR